MKITFPHLGNTYIFMKAILDDFGTDYFIPPFNNKKALELGTKHVPEMACLPLKINIGNYIQAYEKGADTILMAGGCGPCRFGYYCEMQREIIKDAGYDMDIITLELTNGNLGELLKKIRRLAGGANFLRILITAIKGIRMAKRLDELEMLAFRIRARETVKGSTDEILKVFRKRVLEEKGMIAISDVISDTQKKLMGLEVDKTARPLKIGIVGEIYTTIEQSASFDIQNRLGNMGIEVDRQVTVSGWIIEHIIKKALHIPCRMDYADAARPYLGAMIGGHARETLGHTILYSKKGYDGVIQIFPFSCMPEIVAESILPVIEKDYDIPVLTLIIDEMTGEAGYMTRVEAFIDLLEKRRAQTVKQEWILSGS